MPRNTEIFTYHHSKILDLEYAVHKVTGEISFKDGDQIIKYMQDEIKVLQQLRDDPGRTNAEKAIQIKRLYELKKAFSGKVVTEEDIS
jgi:hypothetical protein